MEKLPIPDKMQALADIEEILKSDIELSYLEATTQWMEERAIPDTLLQKYIPELIIEEIKKEAVEDRLMRPSLSAFQDRPTLDFLF